MLPRDLVEEDHLPVAQYRQVRRLARFLRNLGQDRATPVNDAVAGRLGQAADFRPEPQAAAFLGTHHEAFLGQGGGDSLYRRPGQIDPLCDLSQAQPRWIVPQDAQDGSGATDDLDPVSIAFFLHICPSNRDCGHA